MKSYQEECRKDLAKGVELRLEGEPVTIAIDERLMRMITKHFLSNAVKHTKRGSVTLRFKYIDNGLHVEVQDTGDGLPEALKKNIFSLLSDKATFIQDEVPGLGLTICKAIVDRYNGRIGVLSPEEGGTLMWYWIPVKKVTS
jgi:signal transduction histidine kinase